MIADRDEELAVLREADGVLFDVLLAEPADRTGLEVEDAGAVLTGRVARDRETAAIRMPVGDGVFRAGLHGQDLTCAGPIRVDDIGVDVLEVAGVLVGRVADERAVGAPEAPEDGERVTGERCVVGAVGAHLPEVELTGAVRCGRMPLVREHGDPRVVGAELRDVFLRGRIVRELRDRAGPDVDAVEVVLLGPAAVLREHDVAVRAVPGEARPQRARHLAVTDLPRLARGEVHHVELHATALVPVERHAVAFPRDGREIERGQPAELLERDAGLSACGDGHGVCPRLPLQRAQGPRPCAHPRCRSATGTRTMPA